MGIVNASKQTIPHGETKMNYDESLTITRPLEIAYAESDTYEHRETKEDRAFWNYVKDQKRKDDAEYFEKHGTHERQW